MRTLLTYLTLAALCALALVSCTSDAERRLMRDMAVADSLADEDCDSALAMLGGMAGDVAVLPRAVRMRHALLTAKAQNRSFTPFTTDSVMREVAEYYDGHGTPNDRMLAHYLLGCTYRDMHESPVALTCFHDALDRADTLAPDCDFKTMMHIWG